MSEILIPVAKDGEYLEVHPTTLKAHQSLGWVECERQEAADDSESQPQDTEAATKRKYTRKPRPDAPTE